MGIRTVSGAVIHRGDAEHIDVTALAPALQRSIGNRLSGGFGNQLLHAFQYRLVPSGQQGSPVSGEDWGRGLLSLWRQRVVDGPGEKDS